jgi:hypothetical protein
MILDAARNKRRLWMIVATTFLALLVFGLLGALCLRRLQRAWFSRVKGWLDDGSG